MRRKPPRRPTGKYENGYCRPPSEHQFKKGEIHNPHGRPKKPRTFNEALIKVLAETATIRSDGEERVTNLEAIAHALFQKAFGRDKAAQRLFTSLLREIDRQLTEATTESFSGVLQVPQKTLSAIDAAIKAEKERDPNATEEEVKERAWKKVVKEGKA